MMRPIKFRGQRTDTREWVYGDLVQNSVIDALIYGENSKVWSVIPKTVGQFTGLHDKKRTEEYPSGQPIYEGDNVTCTNIGGYGGFDKIMGKIEFTESVAAFGVLYKGKDGHNCWMSMHWTTVFNVIGDIHEKEVGP